MEKGSLETQIIDMLKTIFDPEIPVNIYDLGLVYKIDISKEKKIDISMTLTAPNCPMADDIVAEVYQKVGDITGVKKVEVQLTFDPPWDKDMISEEGQLELGFL